MMKKRIFICLSLCLFALQNAKAEKKPFGNGLYWEINNGTLTITGTGHMPDRFGKGEWWNASFDKVVIGDGIISIGESAFEEFGSNNHIKSVVISNTVTFIGRSAFEYCSSLESVVFGNSVKYIGEFTFAHCTSLKSLVIPNSVSSIKQNAFAYCENLLTVTYTGLLNDIGRDAFFGCNKLTSFPGSSLLGTMKNRKYESAQRINNGHNIFYIVEHHILNVGYRYGLINSDGKVIVPTEMEALESAGTGYLRYKLNGSWGVMNYQGKIIIDTDRGYTSIGDFKTFNKRFSYTMDGYKGECDATGRQISKIKVDTPRSNTSVVSSSGSSSSSSSSNSNSGNNTTTIHVEHHHDPVPVQVWKQCTGCYGSGMCQSGCGGSGWFTGYSGNSTRCIGCGGSGKCQFCAGQGGHYEVEYR